MKKKFINFHGIPLKKWEYLHPKIKIKGDEFDV